MEGASEQVVIPEGADTGQILKMRMQLQMWLIRDNCQPGEDIDSNVDRWLEENSKEFRIVFDKLIKESGGVSDLISRWGESEGVETEELMKKRTQILEDIKLKIAKLKQEEAEKIEEDKSDDTVVSRKAA